MVRWLDEAATLIQTDIIFDDPTTGTAFRDRELELTAPTTARRAVFRFNADLDQTSITFSVGTPSMERISGVVQKARADILQLNDVSAGSNAALVIDYLALKGAVNDSVSGLAKAWALADDLRGLSVGEEFAFGQFISRITSQVGGDGPNLIPDSKISTETLWTLGSNWSLNDNSAYGDFTSEGHLKYTASGGTGFGATAVSWVFPVTQLQNYACAFQARSSANFKVRARLYWYKGDGTLISYVTISNVVTTDTAVVVDYEAELTAPAHAKRGEFQVAINRDDSAADVLVGGFAVERVGATLAKTRGQLDDVVNFNLDGSSALFAKLTGVTTEVFGPNGDAGLKVSSQLLQNSVDGIKGGFSLRVNNNGHITGVQATSDLADGVSASSDLLFAADKFFFMGEIYAVGTVGVTNGSKAVVGNSTAWTGSINDGDWFTGPDGRPYKIDTVNGNTSLTLVKNYEGQTDTGETYGVAQAQPLLSIYTEPTMVDGVLIPKGVYLEKAMLRDGIINRAKITDTLESDAYAEDGNGVPTTGVKIDFANDAIKLAGPVISRNLVINEGQFTLTGNMANGTELLFVNSGIKMGKDDVWRVTNDTFVVVATITSGATGPGGIDGDNAFWGLTARLVSGARWNGFPGTAPTLNYRQDPTTTVLMPGNTGTDQRLFFHIKLDATGGVTFTNPTVKWKIFDIT